MSALPDKPSELLELAIGDVLDIEKTPGFVIDTGQWVTRSSVGPCMVCVAGAVMIQRLGDAQELANAKYDDDFHRDTSDHPGEWHKLEALNAFREGSVEEGLCLLDAGDGEMVWDRFIIDYAVDRDAFFSGLRQLASDLREAGL